MTDDIRLAELLCARFSHDLAGPIGAINNGVEFLSEENQAIKEQAIDLIKTSAVQAVSRLQFLRYVYGFVTSGYEVDFKENLQLIDNFFSYTKTQVEWNFASAEASQEYDARVVKILMNALLLASTMIVSNGRIKVDVLAKQKFRISISGRKIFLDDYYREVLNREMKMVEISTKNVHIAYFLKLLAEEKISFKVMRENDDTIDNIILEIGL